MATAVRDLREAVNYPDRAGPAGWEPVPEVAQSLPTISNAGRTYTFRIRRGFRFAPPSGQPVTAETLRATIERTLSPQMRSPFRSYFTDIVGADAYMAGTASHISGVIARGATLTIRLRAPEGDFLALLAGPEMCAVPPNTPPAPQVAPIPSAGPYTVRSYTPGEGIVLVRNPNYRGHRPRRFARIVAALDISPQRADAQVLADSADYAIAPVIGTAEASSLERRYGAGSASARKGRQQYFVNPLAQLDYFVLNTNRPLFANVRLRKAVNYAIDRDALAALGDVFNALPAHPASHYLPPGMAGYVDVSVYPSTPDLRRARALAGDATGRTAVLYTCNEYPCPEQAQIVKTDLAAIGIDVEIREFPVDVLSARRAAPKAGFDLAWAGWIPDYFDPQAMLGPMLEDDAVEPAFPNAVTRAKLAAAARLSGSARYLAYGRLDLEIARSQAPLAAFDNISTQDLFSSRIGCQTYGVYGMDIAALCIRTSPG